MVRRRRFPRPRSDALLAAAMLALALAFAASPGRAPAEPDPAAEADRDGPAPHAGQTVEFADDFSAGLDRWLPLDADRWRVLALGHKADPERRSADGQQADEPTDGDGGDDDEPDYAAELIRPGKQPGGVRRPSAYMLLKDTPLSSFTLEVKLRSLEPARKRGRDACLIFGYRGPTRFHYAHLSNDADGKAHNVVMTVAGDKRFTIHQPPKPDPRLTREWSTVRLTLDPDGKVELYMDDMEQPLMTARLDPDDRAGLVGLGSFNDRAAFARFKLEGQPAEQDIAPADK